ncbi:hypothetical protein BDF20DRAFT_837359 [Mycotypha africana]|uniref:uncharacterized protein n=1 Tax=Mycotypha africana TaxID=64632 RepID=UPI00230159B0|nr:uncharacterized protein BDF20DRAFT_837359 [Mycotypha africana]KAI8973411.1 hypothetical protein BDF20DRAFT_837359 [Mycotypha africana]
MVTLFKGAFFGWHFYLWASSPSLLVNVGSFIYVAYGELSLLDNVSVHLFYCPDTNIASNLTTRISASANSRVSALQIERPSRRSEYVIKSLNASEHSICRVVLDFAGLCSRFHQVQELLKDYPIIKQVAVDSLIFSINCSFMTPVI